jgi:fumarate hydratase class II
MSVDTDILTLREVPIATGATGKRTETDSMGAIEVPASHYWGAQTERSLIHFSIGDDHMPKAVIMPGKVNPTQQEAMVMVCLQVLGEDAIVASAGSQGNFELNAMRPIIVNNVLHSATILGDACDKLRQYSVDGTKLDRHQINRFVGASLMLVTALSPFIGYDKASAIAHKANDEGTTLREAALASGVDADQFDRIADPRTMVGDPRHDLASAAVV